MALSRSLRTCVPRVVSSLTLKSVPTLSSRLFSKAPLDDSLNKQKDKSLHTDGIITHHTHDHTHDHDHVHDSEENTASELQDEDAEPEEMFIMGPAGVEWNGPTRGGRRPEPTRYGDWDRNGRCSDF